MTVALLVGPFSERAHAEGTAATFEVEAEVGRDGVLTVEQTMTFATPVPAQVSQRFETQRDLVGDRRQVFTMSGFSATAQGTEVPLEIEREGRFTTVAIPTNGANQITLRYTVSGAVVNTESGTALQWRLLQGLSAQVARFGASVAIPGAFTYIDCVAGQSQHPGALPLFGGGFRRVDRSPPSGTDRAARVRSSRSRSGSRPGRSPAPRTSSSVGRWRGRSRPGRCR